MQFFLPAIILQGLSKMDEDLKISQREMGSQKFAIALAMDTLNVSGHQDCYLATASQGHLLF